MPRISGFHSVFHIPLNTDISNLMMIDMSQNAVMNHKGIRGSDRESMEAAVNVASIKIKISERKRGLFYNCSGRLLFLLAYG